MNVTFSIIMPVYNSERYLSDAIESVLKQTYEKFELILIDDGSKDASSQICDEYAQRDHRVRVVHKENGGICKARNLGISMAEGKYVGFMDNDDIIEPTMLQECRLLIECHQPDWVKFGKREIMLLDEKIISKKETDFEFKVYEKNDICNNLLRLRCQGAMTFVWDSFVKRENLLHNELDFDEKFPLGNEDIDFCERYALISEKLVVSEKIFYNHYTRLGISASTKYSEEKIQSYIYLLAKSNQRYIENSLLTNENMEEYVAIVTKQIVVNICQRLNDAKKVLSWKQRCIMLQACRECEEFELYCSLGKKRIANESIKLAIYRCLFLHKKYFLLLCVDEYSRKLAYTYRRFKAKRVS